MATSSRMGRPRLPRGAALSRPVFVRFRPADLRALEQWAEEDQSSVPECVRRIVEQALRRRSERA
jgi:hypothetical protein